MVKYAILMLTHNRCADVSRCLDSLLPTLARHDVSCMVLDNASTDGTRQYLESLQQFMRDLYPRWYFFYSEENLGVASGRSRLLELAQETSVWKYCERVIFLDSDTVILDPNWLDVLNKALEPESVGVVGPFGSFVKRDWSGFEAGIPGEVDTVAGALQMWKADLFDYGVKIPLELEKFWHEDAWSCLMARDLGFDVLCVPVGVQHYPAHSGYGQDQKLHDENFEKFRARWQGQKLTRAEGAY